MTHLLSLLEPKTLIAAFGLIGIIAIIFMETGLFFGFFLPGDSLLFTAGFFASQGYFFGSNGFVPVLILFIGTFIAAVAGDSVGYTFGKRVGPSIFTKEDSTFFNKKHIARAQEFYEKKGPSTIILARFMPVIRTFAPIVAGIGNMRYKTFITYNFIGGFLWTALMVGMGYTLGKVIPDPDKYILPAVVVIIIVSAVPALREILRNRRQE